MGKSPQEVLKLTFGETETWLLWPVYKTKNQTGFDSVSFPDIKMVGLAPICLIDRKIMAIILIGYLSDDHLFKWSFKMQQFDLLYYNIIRTIHVYLNRRMKILYSTRSQPTQYLTGYFRSSLCDKLSKYGFNSKLTKINFFVISTFNFAIGLIAVKLKRFIWISVRHRFRIRRTIHKSY